jgi:MoxR-like ATPase
VEETRELGRRLGQVVEAGDVIALEGELGTGKTELVKGIAEALGVLSDRATVLDDWATVWIRLTSKADTRRRLTLVRGPDRIRAVFNAPGD